MPGLLYGAWWISFYEPYLSEHNFAAVPRFVAQLAAAAAGGLFGLGLHAGWGSWRQCSRSSAGGCCDAER